jgi:hypothetical protein
MPHGQVATAGAEVATAVEVLEVVAVSTGAVLVVAGSTGEALPGAVSTALVVSVVDISPMVVSAALAFVVAVLVGATGVATGAITDSLMMSSSVATVIRGGGTGTIPTDITATTITRTVTMDTADTVTDTVMVADQSISGVEPTAAIVD